MKKIVTFLLMLLSPLVFVKPVYAQTHIPNPIRLENLGDLISSLSSFVTPLAVLGFIAMVIYAGYIRMMAAGNPDKEAKSMKVAVAAAVGFAIIALAPLIVKVVGNLIGVEETLVE